MSARYPPRIVCLPAETTETLYRLGAGDRVVGVSGYTVRPPEAREKPKVSAFLNARLDKIEALRPDLILAFSDLQAGIVDVEAVRVLHRELAPTQEPGTRSGLVAELVLDLVDHQREVAIAAVEVLDEQREHLLVGRGEQEVGTAAVLQAEQVVAVLGPPVGGLVGLARQQRGEVHLLEARGVHLRAHDRLDVAVHEVAQRQPAEHARGHAAHEARPHEQAVARDLRVGGVLAQGAQEQGRHAQQHVRASLASRWSC